MVLEESSDAGEVFRITDWEPFELSMVGVPADASVGVGRGDTSLVTDHEEPGTTAEVIQPTNDEDDMQRDNNDGGDDAEAARLAQAARDDAAAAATAATAAATQQRDNDANQANVVVIENEARAAERTRCTEIRRICTRFETPQLIDDAVDNGTTLDELRTLILEARHQARPANLVVSPTDGDGNIGLTPVEASNFRFVRLFRALADPQNKRLQEAAAFELDATRTASHDLHQRDDTRDLRSDYSLPMEVLRQPIATNEYQANMAVRMMRAAMMQRDLTAGTAAEGGDLIATDLLSQSFIDLLRNRAIMMQMATVMTDLVGNVAIPRQTAATVGLFIATEQGAATEDDAAFDQLTLTPKEVGVYQEYSRQLLVQSSIDIEAFVRADLALALALAIDSASINGSGTSGNPEGILNVTGIGDVDLGANGGAPTWAAVVELETDVAIANADVGALAYLTNAVARGKLKTTVKVTAQPIYLIEGGSTNGYNVAVTNQVPSNLTDGLGTNLSAMIFGNFSDLFIALWSGVDILVNPFTGDTTRTTRVTAYQDADVGVRHPESFSAIQDMDTT